MVERDAEHADDHHREGRERVPKFGDQRGDNVVELAEVDAEVPGSSGRGLRSPQGSVVGWRTGAIGSRRELQCAARVAARAERFEKWLRKAAPLRCRSTRRLRRAARPAAEASAKIRRTRTWRRLPSGRGGRGGRNAPPRRLPGAAAAAAAASTSRRRSSQPALNPNVGEPVPSQQMASLSVAPAAAPPGVSPLLAAAVGAAPGGGAARRLELRRRRGPARQGRWSVGDTLAAAEPAAAPPPPPAAARRARRRRAATRRTCSASPPSAPTRWAPTRMSRPR